MNTMPRIFIALFLVIFCTISMYTFAEAKRISGGRSIGNSSSTSRSFSAMKQRTPQKQQKETNTRSNFGGMGGLLTGLLAGSLLGSFLGGGAFSAFSFLDILVGGLLIFFLYKLITGTRENSHQYATINHSGTVPLYEENNATVETETQQSTFSAHDGGIENFDAEDFLKGAKILFNRMQESWASRDLEDIKRFTTKNIFEDITRQVEEDPTPSPVTVIHLQAEVTGTQVLQDEECADVLFNATLKEEEQQENTTLSEIWRFSRTKEKNASWKLDGITQVQM